MPQVIEIYSENNDFQHAEVLKRNREKRQKNKEFFVEGVKAIEQLVANPAWEITAFLYAKDKELSHWAKRILDESRAETHFELPSSLMQKLSDKEESSELIALVRMQPDDLGRIPVSENPLIMVFDRPGSPGNLGTIIRNCDAMRVDGLVITGHAVDLYDPKTINASVGTLFSLPVVRMQSSNDLTPRFARIKAQSGDLQIVGSSARTQVEAAAQDFTRPTILLIGNETLGLSAAYKELCDELVRIPIHGNASSLNVASAAAMLLYEIRLQRKQ